MCVLAGTHWGAHRAEERRERGERARILGATSRRRKRGRRAAAAARTGQGWRRRRRSRQGLPGARKGARAEAQNGADSGDGVTLDAYVRSGQ